MSEIYKRYGVSAGKEEVHAAIKAMKPTDASHAFCQAVQLGSDYHIMHADGAGTKSILAYLAYQETGDASYFEGIAVDSIVMNTDDMLCVGLVNDFIVSNTIGRDAKRIPQEILTAIMRGYQNFADLMSDYGIHIHLCGGETADVGDLVNTVIVDSTAYGRVPVNQFLDASLIDPKKDWVIVGLASDGQASYESKPNSGIGSNGFTAARHELLKKEYAQKFPESFSSSLSIDTVYNGKYSLFDRFDEVNMSLADLLLSPCRTYLPVMKKIYQEHRSELASVIHNTGGGLTKSMNFGRGVRYIKDNIFEAPFLFKLIQRQKNIPFREMWSMFNNGQRIEISCPETVAKSIIDIATEFKINAQIIGRIEACDSSKNEVVVSHAGITETFTKSLT